MPFTPFHMGVGLAAKAVGGRHFSVLTFGIAQVAMDIEPLIGMLRQSPVLHGPTHTYLGAVPIALVAAALTPWLCGPLLRRWNHEVVHYGMPWLQETVSWKPRVLVVSALAPVSEKNLRLSMAGAVVDCFWIANRGDPARRAAPAGPSQKRNRSMLDSDRACLRKLAKWRVVIRFGGAGLERFSSITRHDSNHERSKSSHPDSS